MPNASVPAAAEGLPISTRRRFLAGVAAVPFAAAPAAAVLAADPHVAREAEARALYRRHRETDWGWSMQSDTAACKTANKAHGALMACAQEVCALPPPATLAGLGALALTVALAKEEFMDADCDADEHHVRALIEAVLNVAGVALPADYRGLIFNPDAPETGR